MVWPRYLRLVPRLGLQQADAQDVTQEVFLNLSARMQEFRYDPRGKRFWVAEDAHALRGKIT